MPLDDRHVPGILAAFDLGSRGRLSDGPVASGRLGSIWRLDTDRGSWAVKQVEDATATEARRDHRGRRVPGGGPRRRRPDARRPTGPDRRGDRQRRRRAGAASRHGWTCARRPSTSTPPTSDAWSPRFTGSSSRAAVGTNPWYEAPVGEDRWRGIIRELRAAGAPFTDELEALVPELVALEAFLGAPPRSLRTCHRDLWADNVRRTASRVAVRLRLRQRGPGRPVAGAGAGPRRVQRRRRRHARRAIQARLRRGRRPRPRRRAAGLRDADRPARPHRRGGLSALASRDHRRRARLERGVGARVPRPAVDPGRDRAPACGLSQARGMEVVARCFRPSDHRGPTAGACRRLRAGHVSGIDRWRTGVRGYERARLAGGQLPEIDAVRARNDLTAGILQHDPDGPVGHGPSRRVADFAGYLQATVVGSRPRKVARLERGRSFRRLPSARLRSGRRASRVRPVRRMRR